jgi:hypothetical protein
VTDAHPRCHEKVEPSPSDQDNKTVNGAQTFVEHAICGWYAGFYFGGSLTCSDSTNRA